MARILLIDDDPGVRSVIRQVMERIGHEVEDASDGDAGLRMFRGGVFDLVITDLYMPGKEGIETIQELRDEVERVPILAISGGGRKDTAGPLGDAELLGANATLSKPFSMGELSHAVTRLLDDAAIA